MELGVVHIGTTDRTGGAGIAMWRLHQGLKLSGVESKVVSRYRKSEDADVSIISNPIFEAVDALHQQSIAPAQPDGATLFTVASTAVSLLQHPWIAAADVIHLHWVAQFISPEDIEQLCKAGKTVFWTFHDQWPYTGGCHYIGGTRREAQDWDGTAQIDGRIHHLVRSEFARKKDILRHLPIQVIAPSKWMAREAANSGVFEPEKIHVVPYGVDTTVFAPNISPTDKPVEEAVTLLFGCETLEETRKGYQLLKKAISRCMEEPNFVRDIESGRIRLITFGRPSSTPLDLGAPATHLGTLNGELQIAETLRSSSAFLCPTLDDNLPNVVMEALACGCPVIGFSTGGVPDMVEHGWNGILVPTGDSDALAKQLLLFCNDTEFREKIIEQARTVDRNKWSIQRQAEQMCALYEKAVPQRSQFSKKPKFEQCLSLMSIEASVHTNYATEMSLAVLAQTQQKQKESETKLQKRIDHLTERLDTEIQKKNLLKGKLVKQAAKDERKSLLARLWSKLGR